MDKKKVRSVSSQVMELQQLIAGPLIATIEADSLSSQRYLDYLMKIALNLMILQQDGPVRYVCLRSTIRVRMPVEEENKV